MKKIYSELSRIQQELKAPKNLYNSFGKYAYRNAEGILEAVKPLLSGLALVINDEPVLIGDRFYIKATVTLTDGEDSVSAVAYAREDEAKKGMDGCQITGACSSYARKYALNALLMIDDSKDSDDESLSPKNPANNQEKEKKASNKVQGFLEANTKLMMQAFNIPDEDEMKRKISQWKKELTEEGKIPNVRFSDMDLDQAEEFVDAIYTYYKPSGARK